jgi:hypothetical protein
VVACADLSAFRLRCLFTRAHTGLSVWGIASLSGSDPFGLYKFKNISLPVLDLLKCPQSFCNKTVSYTGSITGNSSLPAYGQCGGAGGECAKYGTCADMAFPGFRCTTGWSCQRQHRWYYQCLPATLIPSTTGCDLSLFGEPMATMMQGLGVICSLKAGLVSFALNPAQVPKIIDPFAMLQVFSGERQQASTRRIMQQLSGRDVSCTGSHCRKDAC